MSYAHVGLTSGSGGTSKGSGNAEEGSAVDRARARRDASWVGTEEVGPGS